MATHSSSTPSLASPGILPNLDLLRAFAVVLVVIDHTALARGNFHLPFHWAASWLGTVGVFIFFVHTSLVLMWSLERAPNTLNFYTRRIFRIYPLTLVAILLTLLFHAPVAGPIADFFQYHPPSLRTLVSNALLIQNLVPYQPHFIGVLWSLPIEVQMYVILPALFAWAHRERAIWPFLLLWVLVCAVCRVTLPGDAISLPIAIPYFLPGIMAYLGYRRRTPSLPAALLLPTLIVLILLFMHKPTPHNGWTFCLLLGLSLPFFRQLQPGWLARAAHQVAQYSFGIYLFHPFALVLAFHLRPSLPFAAQLTIELLAIALFSVLGYHLVELPCMRLGSRVAILLQRRSRQHAPANNIPLPL